MSADLHRFRRSRFGSGSKETSPSLGGVLSPSLWFKPFSVKDSRVWTDPAFVPEGFLRRSGRFRLPAAPSLFSELRCSLVSVSEFVLLTASTFGFEAAAVLPGTHEYLQYKQRARGLYGLVA